MDTEDTVDGLGSNNSQVGTDMKLGEANKMKGWNSYRKVEANDKVSRDHIMVPVRYVRRMDTVQISAQRMVRDLKDNYTPVG